MNVSGVGDLAASLLSRRSNANLKAELVRLSQEVTTGRKGDLSEATQGNLAPVASIQRTLSLLDVYDASTARASAKLDFQQNALNVLSSDISSLGPNLLSAAAAGSSAVSSTISSASLSFETAVSALNSHIGGTHVFSGINTNTSPVADAESMLVELEARVSGVTSAADFVQIVDDWFNLPGGYNTSGYRGSVVDQEGIRVSTTEAVKIDISADNQSIRNTLRDFAVVSLLARGAFSGTAEELNEAVKLVGSASLKSSDQLISLQAKIGLSQSRIEQATALNSSQRFSLTTALSEITNVDIYDAATQLEQVETQLESLYLVTAKTSRLSLTEYLR